MKHYVVTIHSYSGAIIDQIVGQDYFDKNTPDKALYVNQDFEGKGRVICVKDNRGRIYL